MGNNVSSTERETPASVDCIYKVEKRSDLAKVAKSHISKTNWATNVRKAPNDPRISRHIFPEGKPKHSLFVSDMLYNVGITPPITGNGKRPISSRMWTSYLSGWRKVGPTQQEGDVVSNGKFCGIAVDSRRIIMAGADKIYTLNQDIPNKTIQRFRTNADAEANNDDDWSSSSDSDSD